MKRFAIWTSLWTMIAFLVFIGCSGSDEVKKEQETGAGGEFGTVSGDTVIVPKTTTPPGTGGAERELPQAEKEMGGTRDAPPAPVQNPPVQPPPAGQTPTGGTPPKTGITMWSVQIGAFKSESGATQCANDARSRFNQPIYKDLDPVTGFYKVTVGSFSSYEPASAYKLEVQAKGYPDAFPVEVKR